MKTKTINYSFLFILIFFVSCMDNEEINGSGNIVTEERIVNPFLKVDTPSSLNIEIIYGLEQKITIVADDNIINFIRTSVSNSTLKVDLTSNNYDDITATVQITTPNIIAIKNSGSGSLSISDFIDLENIELINSGSGSVILKNATVSFFDIKNSGSGSFLGFEATIAKCKISNTGSGSCEIKITEELTGTNSGSGSIFYKGSGIISISNNGSGNIINLN